MAMDKGDPTFSRQARFHLRYPTLQEALPDLSEHEAAAR